MTKLTGMGLRQEVERRSWSRFRPQQAIVLGFDWRWIGEIYPNLRVRIKPKVTEGSFG